MPRFTEGDRVRVDLPDENDPDHDRYHGLHGTVIAIVEDDAAEITGDDRDNYLFQSILEQSLVPQALSS